MKTVTRTAINPTTGNKYEIELPTPEIVREAILELDYPPDGIRIISATQLLSDKFQLTDEQRKALQKRGNKYLDLFRYSIVAPAFKYLLTKGQLKQPGGKGKPYRLADVPPPPPHPSGSIEEIYQEIRKRLAKDLLQRIKENTPVFFEKLVVDLLVKMGYGGSREDAGKAVGGSGDGGIDGIINEDRLGLDVVYVQAKRWEGSVSRPEIQRFAGALQGQRARKGVFITTSNFTRDAKEYVDTIDSKIVLIDGKQLTEYMIDHDIGVSTTKTYEIKRVDSDYFAENTENS